MYPQQPCSMFTMSSVDGNSKLCALDAAHLRAAAATASAERSTSLSRHPSRLHGLISLHVCMPLITTLRRCRCRRQRMPQARPARTPCPGGVSQHTEIAYCWHHAGQPASHGWCSTPRGCQCLQPSCSAVAYWYLSPRLRCSSVLTKLPCLCCLAQPSESPKLTSGLLGDHLA